MPYESAPELSAFFQRMGVPLKVVDDPNNGKYVMASADIMPDVVEGEEKRDGNTSATATSAVLETAALFEESGIASWPNSELLNALERNYAILLNKTRTPSPAAADLADNTLIGYCNESLALCFCGGTEKKKKGANSDACVTLVSDELFTSGNNAAAASTLPSAAANVTPFLYATPEAQQRDVFAAAILGARGALRSLRQYHAALEKEAATMEQQMIPISVESIARSIVTAVVRFLQSLQRSVKAQFSGLPPSADSAAKRLAIVRELFASVAAEEAEAAAEDDDNSNVSCPDLAYPNPFVTNLFEMSVRPFNRLVEPPEGSEFEASVKAAEWCTVVRDAIQQNIIDLVRKVVSDLIHEVVGTSSSSPPVASLVLSSNNTASAPSSENATATSSKALAALLAVLPATAVKTLAVTASSSGGDAVDVSSFLDWVPQVVEGWLNDATIITLLGQTTINAQALTAVAAADAAGLIPTSTANAAVEVMQIIREEGDDDNADDDATVYDGSKGTLVTKSNIHQRVPVFGAAVFTLQSCFNHSCAPNAEVVPTLPYGLGGHDIVVQAIPKDKRFTSKGKIAGAGGDDDEDEEKEKDSGDKKKSSSSSADKSSNSKKEKVKPLIKEGEEVNITYIPMLYLALEDYQSRRERLESYFFVCECKRCFRENAKAEKAEAKARNKEAKSKK